MNVGILPGFPQYGIDQGVLPGLPASRASHEDVVRGIAGLKQWYAADKIPGVTHGSGVALWSDVSGNGFDVVQATAGNQPVFETDIFNGQPAVKFTAASSQYLENTTQDPFAAGAARTVFVAARNTQLGSAGATFICFRLTARAAVYQTYVDSSNPGLFFTDGTSISNNSPPINGMTETLGIYCARTTAGAVGKFRMNGGNCTTSGGSLVAEAGTTGFYIGRRELAPPTSYMGGHIAEIITYAGELSDADCLLVEKSLMRKYFDLR